MSASGNLQMRLKFPFLTFIIISRTISAPLRFPTVKPPRNPHKICKDACVLVRNVRLIRLSGPTNVVFIVIINLSSVKGLSILFECRLYLPLMVMRANSAHSLQSNPNHERNNCRKSTEYSGRVVLKTALREGQYANVRARGRNMI